MKALRGASARNLLGPLVRSTYRVRVAGGHSVPGQGGVLVLSTYSGIFDSMILATNLTRPVAVLVGEGGVPPTWRQAIGRIVVPAERPGEALREAVGLLRSGHAVAMFPEGCAGAGGDFGAGAAYLQARTGVPVVPVALIGSAGSRPTDPPRPRSTIDVVVGESFTPPAVKDSARRAEVAAIAEQMRQRFTDHVRHSRSRAGQSVSGGTTGHNGAL
jgi:1-acyl-sn-glycerol-3-phosphate acyltransferase